MLHLLHIFFIIMYRTVLKIVSDKVRLSGDQYKLYQGLGALFLPKFKIPPTHSLIGQSIKMLHYNFGGSSLRIFSISLLTISSRRSACSLLTNIRNIRFSSVVFVALINMRFMRSSSGSVVTVCGGMFTGKVFMVCAERISISWMIKTGAKI